MRGRHQWRGRPSAGQRGLFSVSLFGEPAEVASTLRDLAATGITRIEIGAVHGSAYEQLAAQVMDVRAN